MRLKVLLLGVTTMLVGVVTGIPPAAAHGACTVYTAGVAGVPPYLSATGMIDCSPTAHTYYELYVCIERSQLPEPLANDAFDYYELIPCQYSAYDDSGGTGTTRFSDTQYQNGTPPCATPPRLWAYRARVIAHARNHTWQTYTSLGVNHLC